MHILKHFLEEGLDSRGVFGLAENVEQVVIGEEVETGELFPFLAQVVV
jgi:hypothetical protein